ncbi:MAG: GxxExxY protein [Chitinophagales bacterium]
MNENEIAKFVVNAAYQVHKELGPGLLESVYENCLFYELQEIGLEVKQQHILPVIYKDVKMEMGFRLDLLVEDKLVVEVKAVKELEDIHMAQIISYLKLSNNKLGLLINFHVPLIKNGIKRVINGKL